MAGRRLSVDIERRHRGGPTIRAAFEVDLDAGEVLALFGPSGSGKTTVLRCVAGLERPQAGTIVSDGQTWFHAGRGSSFPPQARRVGYVPQGYALFPHLSVRDNLAYGIRGVGRAERERRVDGLLASLGITHLAERRPSRLSGGERQRVAVGRALASDPMLLLLDEPLAALDEATKGEVRTALAETVRGAGTAALLVSHDPTDVLALADRVAVLVDGAIRQIGPADEVFLRPVDEVVARLVGANVLGFGIIATSADGIVEVDLRGHRLTAVGGLSRGTRVLVSVRPEEVTLLEAPLSAAHLSARNVLPSTVARLDPRGTLVLVTLDPGFPLRALITRQAVAELELAPGVLVGAAIKAPSIHLAPAPRGAGGDAQG
ncbi:MAG: ABC transporter ATP-binding protein [Candidatus Limnocylindrales bacterium]